MFLTLSLPATCSVILSLKALVIWPALVAVWVFQIVHPPPETIPDSRGHIHFPNTIWQILQRHESRGHLGSFFPPCACRSPAWTRLPGSLSATKLHPAVPRKSKCSFSLFLISKQGFLQSIFHSPTVAPMGTVPPPSRVLMTTFYKVLFFCIYTQFSSYPLLAPHRCSYRFTTQALVVLQRRSRRMSRLLTSE